ncbi:MAG TPA: DUF1349 domain-containing protein [Opitutaceae bacterium]
MKLARSFSTRPGASARFMAAAAGAPIRKSLALAWLAAVATAFVPGASAAQLALNWEDNSSNESGFKVERAVGSGAFAQITTTGANATGFTDTSLNEATTYSYRVRAYNSIRDSTYSNVATMTTPSTTNPPSTTNTAPTISDITNKTVSTGGTTGAIAFTVGDAQTAAGSLTLTRGSSNTTLVPTANIVLGGSGANRTVMVTPAANQTGSATITVTVSDGSLTASDSFVLTVGSAPSLTSNVIGSPAIAGSTSYSANTGTYKVKAAGTDIWGTSDQFRFVRQNVNGDATLIVRLKALTNTDGWAKAGLMLRTSTAANAQHVSVFATPGNGVMMQARQTQGGSSWSGARLSQSIPEWLRLDRVGNTFYAFRSEDGVNWQMVDYITVNLPASLLGGMAVTSHNPAKATTATFTNFSVD